MRTERTDHDRVAFLLDAFELCDAGEIDDRSGIGEPQLHRADQALSAGERLAAFGERRRRVGHRLRTLIFECVHDGLQVSRQWFAAWIALHTRCGVAGMSMLFTPTAESASCTAFMSAAGAPIAPASPQPFAPSGLCVQGVTLVATLNDGRSSARGIA